MKSSIFVGNWKQISEITVGEIIWYPRVFFTSTHECPPPHHSCSHLWINTNRIWKYWWIILDGVIERFFSNKLLVKSSFVFDTVLLFKIQMRKFLLILKVTIKSTILYENFTLAEHQLYIIYVIKLDEFVPGEIYFLHWLLHVAKFVAIYNLLFYLWKSL